ncbi:MAG TPA: iron-sulfur cluster repair di-iron protein [Pyrinomonadaceae bacterium]|nr:iron-sulfur cluster repair di-iron protein [Pyrinomonadaceae bacterium]
MMNQITTKTIREIALEAPATTRVFEEFNIDYCCGGRRSIADACAAKGIDASVILERIDLVMNESPDAIDVPERLGPTDLANYIIAKHHVFTVSEIERLTPLMAKVVMRHGEHHGELFELQKVFSELAESLFPHMQKEENILFPFIEQLDAAAKRGMVPPIPHFGTVRNPIRMMMNEHDVDGERLRKMREIANDYALPEGACPSFTALYAGLEDLERDLHRHIHLENNVLFPAAAELEG